MYTERAAETADSLDDVVDSNLTSESDERVSQSADDQSYEDREDWEILGIDEMVSNQEGLLKWKEGVDKHLRRFYTGMCATERRHC